jgi:hypothetical protein
VFAGDDIILEAQSDAGHAEPKRSRWNWREPGVWAIIAIVGIGALNLLGPKHTAGFALAAAGGMIAITLLVVVCAIPQIDWRHLHLGRLER